MKKGTSIWKLLSCAGWRLPFCNPHMLLRLSGPSSWPAISESLVIWVTIAAAFTRLDSGTCMGPVWDLYGTCSTSSTRSTRSTRSSVLWEFTSHTSPNVQTVQTISVFCVFSVFSVLCQGAKPHWLWPLAWGRCPTCWRESRRDRTLPSCSLGGSTAPLVLAAPNC